MTAAPRTGILDTMEACHPRVRGTNPPVGEGGERRGGSNIVYRHKVVPLMDAAASQTYLADHR